MFINVLTLIYDVAFPLAELSINVINVMTINEMINNPKSGYGQGNILQDIYEKLYPYTLGNFSIFKAR